MSCKFRCELIVSPNVFEMSEDRMPEAMIVKLPVNSRYPIALLVTTKPLACIMRIAVVFIWDVRE